MVPGTPAASVAARWRKSWKWSRASTPALFLAFDHVTVKLRRVRDAPWAGEQQPVGRLLRVRGHVLDEGGQQVRRDAYLTDARAGLRRSDADVTALDLDELLDDLKPPVQWVDAVPSQRHQLAPATPGHGRQSHQDGIACWDALGPAVPPRPAWVAFARRSVPGQRRGSCTGCGL